MLSKQGGAAYALADFLREELLLTGTHLGCEQGVCGACTVMIDGRPARSCLALAVACDSADVRTVESFDDDPLMEQLRDAFTRHHGLQCGFCTPGLLATAYDVVRRLPGCDAARIRKEISGNLCRCTGYQARSQRLKMSLQRSGKCLASTGTTFPFTCYDRTIRGGRIASCHAGELDFEFVVAG